MTTSTNNDYDNCSAKSRRQPDRKGIVRRQMMMVVLVMILALGSGYASLPRIVPAGHQTYEIFDHFIAKRMLLEDRDLYRRGEVMERNQASLVTMRLVNHCIRPENEGRITSWDIKRLVSLIDEFEVELRTLFDLDVEDARWRLGRMASTAPPEPGTINNSGVVFSEVPSSFAPESNGNPRFVVNFTPSAVKSTADEKVVNDNYRDKIFDTRITINARDTSVRDIVYLLFKDTPYSIDVDERGMDRMTLQLKEVPLREALELIRAKGISIEKNGNMFIFSMSTEEMQELIHLNHVKVSDVLDTVRRFRSPRGTIDADARTNNLIIKETSENLDKIRELIAELDVESEETVVITEVFAFRYTNATDMRSMVNDIKSREGKIEVDRRLNALVVQDTVSRVKRMADLFNALDIPSTNPGLVTRVYRLNYADPDEVKKVLDSNAVTRSGSGDMKAEIQVDERTNSLIISEFKERHQAIEEYISLLDTPTRQVHIEAKIMEINMVDKDLFGIKWSALMPDEGSNKPIDDETVYEMDFSEADAALSQLKFGTLARDQFSLLLQFLLNKTNTKILATPAITVVDKDEAEINVGASVPIPKYERNSTTGNMEITGYDEKKTGITLTVKPVISHSDNILLDVQPKIDEITEYRGQFNEIPVTANREARTKIMVQDGRTLVIAGLIKEKTTEAQIKVPFLHRLPLIGNAFKKRSNNVEKSETVIFITPNIINAGGV